MEQDPFGGVRILNDTSPFAEGQSVTRHLPFLSFAEGFEVPSRSLVSRWFSRGSLLEFVPGNFSELRVRSRLPDLSRVGAWDAHGRTHRISTTSRGLTGRKEAYCSSGLKISYQHHKPGIQQEQSANNPANTPRPSLEVKQAK